MKSQIRKAVITQDRTDIKNQCEYMETPRPYYAITPYGFVSKAKDGSMVLLMNLNDDQSNKVGIEYDNKKLLDTLETGEVALYHPDKKSYVICRNNGDIEIVSKDSDATIKVQNDGKIAIGVGGVELLDEIETVFTSFQTNEATFVSTAVGPGKLNPTVLTAIDTIITNISGIKGSL